MKKKNRLPPIDDKATTESKLDSIIPPREWLENSIKYKQPALRQIAHKDDVSELMNMLDKKITERQARENGVCPVREELFAQCFDELIRQVTLDCPERGLLLAKVRDDLKKTINAYQALYESAVEYSIRKKKQTQQGKPEYLGKIQELQAINAKLKKKEAELKLKKEIVDKKVQENKDLDEQRRSAEKDFLKSLYDNLYSYLKGLSEGQSPSNK